MHIRFNFLRLVRQWFKKIFGNSLGKFLRNIDNDILVGAEAQTCCSSPLSYSSALTLTKYQSHNEPEPHTHWSEIASVLLVLLIMRVAVVFGSRLPAAPIQSTLYTNRIIDSRIFFLLRIQEAGKQCLLGRLNGWTQSNRKKNTSKHA